MPDGSGLFFRPVINWKNKPFRSGVSLETPGCVQLQHPDLALTCRTHTRHMPMKNMYILYHSSRIHGDQLPLVSVDLYVRVGAYVYMRVCVRVPEYCVRASM